MTRLPTALVLGAGIMGLCAAWGLARAGFRVEVVEQDPVPNPRGASVDEHRLIRHAYGSQHGYMRMVAPAYRAWDALWRDLGRALHVPTGVLALAGTPGGWLAQSRDALRGDGHGVETLSAARVAAQYPFLDPAGIVAAFRMRAGGVLLARPIVAALAAHLARRGVTLTRARAETVDAARAMIRLQDGGMRAADLLVVAAGPWAPRLLPALAARVRPSRQVVVYLAPPADLAEAWARAPMLLDIGEGAGFYAVPPVAGTPLKVGDHRFSRRGDAEADPREASAPEVEEILAQVRPRLRAAVTYRVLGGRACYYDVEERERFILEPLSPGCFVMTGFSGQGFKFAPLLGLALARAASDRALAPGLPAWAAGEAPPPPGLLDALESASA
ncbi:MAG TPA: FAD-dependent oxidoreductase [Acetobacteraceae bacterium]|nr:FAD-dependent oxidoreductase [Acetobacteraceae bacterium]